MRRRTIQLRSGTWEWSVVDPDDPRTRGWSRTSRPRTTTVANANGGDGAQSAWAEETPAGAPPLPKRRIELRSTEDAVTFAVKNGLPVMYVTEDTTRAAPGVVKALYRTAIECGARRICVCDTVGHATPHGVRQLIRFVFDEVVKPSGEENWDGGVEAVYEANDNTFAFPANPADADFRTAWQDAVNRVLNGQAEPAAALAEAQEKAQTALDKAWENWDNEQGR